MSALWRDVRFGLRALRRKPGFTIAALLSLVLGIGTNTGVFSLLYSLYLEPLPVRDLDRLVAVFQSWQLENGEFEGAYGLAYDNYLDYRQNTRTLDDLALFLQSPMSLTSGDTAEQITGIFATANYFDVLGLQVSRGRFFQPEEEALPDGLPVAVLSHGGWQRLFASDPKVVGRTVQINGVDHTIIGVGPEGFRGTELWVSADLWVPLPRFRLLSPYRNLFAARDASVFSAVGRLRPGASAEQVQKELTSMSAEISRTYFSPPDFMAAVVRPLRTTLLPANERHRFFGLGWTLIVGVAVILLSACLNVASLILVQGLERDREIAVRQAVGARRPAVVRQLMVESLLLFLVGAALSLPVAWWTLRTLWTYRPPQFAENALDPNLHPVALAFALALALVTGVVFGIVPALRVSRVQLVRSLKEGDAVPATVAGLRFHPRSLLVSLQVALALVALVGAGLFYRSMVNLRSIELGFQPDHLALMRISPGEQGMPEAQGRDLYRRVLERLGSEPGVESAALSENRLLRGAVMKLQVYPEGRSTAVVSELGDQHRANAVSPGYFTTVGIPLIEGRDFDDSIRPDGPPVAIINKRMADSVWPGESAVGRRFRFSYPDDREPLIEVVGVAANALYRDLQEPSQFFIYLPLAQHYSETVTVHVRTASAPGPMLPVLRQSLRQVEKGLVVSDVHSMSFYIGSAMWIERLALITLAAFGALAMALAIVGVCGVVSFTVRRMQRDLSIRRALGARAGEVMRRVLVEALASVGVGVVLGWILAYFALRPRIESHLVDVHAGDPTVYAFQALLLILVALVSSLVPALRSLRLDPMAVLREE